MKYNLQGNGDWGLEIGSISNPQSPISKTSNLQPSFPNLNPLYAGLSCSSFPLLSKKSICPA
jgi:hypothetical protein